MKINENDEQELAKARAAAVEPSQLFRQGAHADRWGSYDDEGRPLTTKDGAPLFKSQQKATAKEQKNHEKAYEKLVKAAGGADQIEAHLASLEEALKELKLE